MQSHSSGMHQPHSSAILLLIKKKLNQPHLWAMSRETTFPITPCCSSEVVQCNVPAVVAAAVESVSLGHEALPRSHMVDAPVPRAGVCAAAQAQRRDGSE